MTIKEILAKWLADNGYDGLAYDGCGCAIGELMMCEAPCEYCEPAYKGIAPEDEDPGVWFYSNKQDAEASLAGKDKP